MDRAKPAVIALRLRHPDLDFYVDVTLTEHEGRWLAVAMLADEPDIGTGTDPREALRTAWRRSASRSPRRWQRARRCPPRVASGPSRSPW
jgi:hypothetical protein